MPVPCTSQKGDEDSSSSNPLTRIISFLTKDTYTYNEDPPAPTNHMVKM